MEGVLGIFAGILGTLLGSTLQYVFQRRNASHANKLARDEALRRERVAAYSSLGGALATYRRSQIDRWYAKHGNGGESVPERDSDARQQRDRAQEALFRVQLLTDSPEVAERAREAFDSMTAFGHADTRSEAEAIRDQTHIRVRNFVEAAKAQLQAELNPSRPREH